jgi:hypothetical protein
MKLYEMDSEYIECDCHTELIQLTYEEPENKDKEPVDFLYIALYEYGSKRDNRFSWKERFKHIFYILKYGTPWKDQLILRTEERLKLMNYLNKVEQKRLEYKIND